MAEQRRRESISVVSAPEEIDVHAEVGAARWLALEVGMAIRSAEESHGGDGGTEGVPTSRASSRRGKERALGCLERGLEPRKKDVIPDERQA